MPYAVNCCRGTVLIIRGELETIQIGTCIKCLVSIELLIVHYIQGFGIQKSADSEAVFKNTFEFEINVIPNRELPFFKVDIRSQQSGYSRLERNGEGGIFGSDREP